LAGEALLWLAPEIWYHHILKILDRVPVPSVGLAFLALADCDFLDLEGAGDITFLKKVTTAFSSPFFFGAAAAAGLAGEDDRPRKDPLLFGFGFGPKRFPI